MLQKKTRVHIFTRGMKGGIRSINTPVYDVSLYELLKSYASIQMQKTFQNIVFQSYQSLLQKKALNTLKII